MQDIREWDADIVKKYHAFYAARGYLHERAQRLKGSR